MTVTVTTGQPYYVRGTSGFFKGELTDLDGKASVDCYFQYRIKLAATWDDTSAAAETLSALGEFVSASITLTEGELYEVRAVATWDDGGAQYAYGSTIEFDAAWVREGSEEDFERGILDGVEVVDDMLSIDRSMVAFWRFESAALTVDSQGGNTLVAYGSPTADTADYKEGGGCVDLDVAGNDHYQLTAANTDAGFPLQTGDTTKTITMCGWFKPESFTKWHGLMGKANYAFAARQGVGLFANSAGLLHIGWGSVGSDYNTGVTLGTGKWYHLAVVADGVAKKMFMMAYDADADLVYTFVANAASEMSVGTQEFRIGNFEGTLAQTFNGKIDAVMVFDECLSGADITSIRIATQRIGMRSLPYLIAGTSADIAWTAPRPTVIVDAQVQGTTAVTNEAVGTGDGVTPVFYLDHWPANTPTITVNAVAETGFTLGTDRRKITFDANPADTHAIVASYTAVDDPVAGAVEIQELDLDSPTGGTFKLGDGTTWTADLAYDATPATIEAALEGLYGAGKVSVAYQDPSWALAFDGTIGHIIINSSDMDFSANEASIALWIKLTLATPTIISKTGILAVEPITSSVSHYPYTNGLGYFKTFRSARVDGITLSGSVDRTSWHLVTITTKPGTNGWQLYQNATLVHQTTGEASVKHENELFFGRSFAGYYLDGQIRSVMLYNKALSSTEVSDLHSGTLVTDGLIHHYELDEGEGVLVYDSLSSHRGAIAGSDWTLTSPCYKHIITFNASVGNSNLTADFTGLT